MSRLVSFSAFSGDPAVSGCAMFGEHSIQKICSQLSEKLRGYASMTLIPEKSPLNAASSTGFM